jgi:TonB-dependent siderophore receptor
MTDSTRHLAGTRHSRALIAAAVSTAISSWAQAQQPAAKPEDLEEVIVTGLTFKYNTVETANKMDLAIKDTPQSVKVITADMLEFSGITKFEDVYKIDAGSHSSHAQDGFVRNYFRGFKLDSNNAVKLDGLRMPGIIEPDLSPFERFEIIKGPTSTIYGQSPIAGTLNAVSKKPLREFGGSVSLEAGNFDHKRGEVDIYGPAGEKFAYRVVGSYLDQESFLDYVFTKRKVLAPSMEYDIGENTRLTVMGQYQDIDFLPSYGSGVQVLGGDDADPANYRIAPAPRSRFYGLPTGLSEREFLFSRSLLEHEFGNDWKLRANAQYSESDVINRGSYGGTASPDNFTQLYMYRSETDSEAYSGEVNLFGDVEVGGREHTLFFGVDYARENYRQALSYGSIAPDAFNFVDPDYASLPDYPPSIAEFTPENIPDYSGIFLRRKSVVEETGFTFQTVLKPTDRLSFLIGTRYSRVEIGSVEHCCEIESLDPLPHGFGADDTFTNSKWTVQVGSTFAITPRVNLYANYGQTFLPRDEFAFNPDDPDNGTSVGPEEGESYEIGAKGELFDGQVSWSTAVFDIARTNITENDFDNPGFSIVRGKQRSRGVEVDAQGQIVAGWDVYLSLAKIDNKYVGGDYDGYPSFITPKFGASLFTSYEIQDGAAQGLGFGGGFVYKQTGEVWQFDGPAPAGADFSHLFKDVTELDLRAFYERGPWNYSLSVTNVLDTKYYSPEDNNFWYAISVNPGRQYIGRLSYSFN